MVDGDTEADAPHVAKHCPEEEPLEESKEKRKAAEFFSSKCTDHGSTTRGGWTAVEDEAKIAEGFVDLHDGSVAD